MDFVKEVLEGLDYRVDEKSLAMREIQDGRQIYSYSQSQQINMQAGFIGYLRGDFGTGDKEFFSSWFDHRRDLKADEFKNELNEVINALRSDEYGLLKNRTAMAQYAGKYPDSAFQGNYATEYGFRVDTEKHAFLIRCNLLVGIITSIVTAMCGNGLTAILKKQAVESVLSLPITRKSLQPRRRINSHYFK